jgi:uncharacterized glyoxalase superfamily protein PhnB
VKSEPISSGKGGSVQPIPAGYHSVTPWIVSRDTARVIEFLKEAFGAEEIARVYNKDGSIGHAEVRIGDSVVMPFDAKADWPDTPAFLRLYVEDGDAVFRQALRAGATAVTEMTHMPWGDRVGRVRDPLGNLWWIQSRVEQLSLEEIETRLGEERFVEAMRYVQGAELFSSDRSRVEPV